MNLISIAALQDNYIWLLSNKENHCVVVDPGEAQPVLDALGKHRLTPEAILLTHHHHDHVGGVAAIVEHYAHLPVLAPGNPKSGTTTVVEEGDTLPLLNSDFSVLAVPGHTAGHIAYYSHPFLFCGDTLFPADAGEFSKALQIKCMIQLKNIRPTR